MGQVATKCQECTASLDQLMPEQKPFPPAPHRMALIAENKRLKEEMEDLVRKLVRTEKDKSMALQKLEKRLARREKLEKLEAAEDEEEKERIRNATIQWKTNEDGRSTAVVLVSASTGLPVAESLASHVEKLLTTTVQDCILFDSDGQEVPSENLVEACLLPRASAASMSKVVSMAARKATPEALPVLVALCKEVPTIASLSLSGIGLGDAGTATLASALTHTAPPLVTLDLSNNAIGVDGCRALAGSLHALKSLEVLVLHDNLIGVESAKVLAQKVSSKNASDVSPTLDWVTVTEKVALPVGALKRNDLSTLDLGRMKLGAADAIILAAALRTNSSLTVLDLPYNKIKVEGAKALAAALTPNKEAYNTSLTSLNLIGNTVGPEGAAALAAALTPNDEGLYCNVHTLNLAVNNIQDEGAKSLAKALAPQYHTDVVNKTLDTLILWGNNIEAAGAEAIAKSLATNQQPHFALDLSCNALGLACRDLFPEHVRVKFLEQPLSSGKPILSPVVSVNEQHLAAH
mmetsp:Transcript_18625/g.35483  ORF Transcript_18625/g.35483 Transcript_18625/m.35483 type:complete len:520 (-) Transcript_18625:262-1821(-)|eukprot:CAMPEP_0114259798 /NCGR_PEP_ID=MMETSP0058-20121206/20097_1 /TAXON_ID=36894 /ORGANISM="Pyramimonas parkeae, CCMP726" /LENGTH=519 /DNA_ID=CAMNT_0001374893 /DNA_START=93 /DNA_END=1652 /DNA_ORIENTATION=-